MGTVITPWHVIGANHYQHMTGDILYFLDSTNTVVSAIIVDKSPFPPVGAYMDIIVYKLDRELPNTVKTYKFIPDNFVDYFPINSFTYSTVYDTQLSTLSSVYLGVQTGLPLIAFSHYRWDSEWPLSRPNRYTYLFQMNTATTRFSSTNIALTDGSLTYIPASNFMGIQLVEDNNVYAYNGVSSEKYVIQGGDSGGPVFLILSGEPILMGSHLTPWGAPFYSSGLEYIQNYLNNLPVSGEVYKLQVADLSSYGFRNYTEENII